MGLATTPRGPRIYGHRGSRLRRRDNTLDSFRLALEEGAHGVETDVRRLADGSLVLFHAELVDDRPTNTLMPEELSKHHPELARPADLSEFGTRAELILEVKERGCELQLADQVAGMSSVVICSFDHRVITELARIRAVTSASFRLGVTIAGRLIGGPAYVRGLGADWFFPASSFIDVETVAEFNEEEIAVVPWVLNHELQWQSAVAWGCHGFITDDPKQASTWLGSSGGGTA